MTASMQSDGKYRLLYTKLQGFALFPTGNTEIITIIIKCRNEQWGLSHQKNSPYIRNKNNPKLLGS